jgi:hypothetical protein
MWFVTAKAVFIGHILYMGFMAFHALCGLPVGHMTFFTVQSSMCTRMGFHFLTLIRMAGETRSLNLAHLRQIHLQRIVGVVAGLALLKTKMNVLPRVMALVTCWNGVLPYRRVLLVTLETTNVLVQRPPLVDLFCGFVVTLTTVLLRY